MRRSIVLILILACCGCMTGTVHGDAPSQVERPVNSSCVILLHGLGRTHMSMAAMAHALEIRGYRVTNLSYPSREATIEVLTREHLAPTLARCHETGCRVVHMVAHSLGSIMIRQYLQTHSLPAGSRIVMLSPPNQGSELADYLRSNRLYQWVTGPAGQQLGTRPDSVPRQLAPVDVPVGVITGSESWNPLFSYWIPGADDGKVSVARARLEEMTDFLVVPASHTFIMEDDDVIAQTIHFLEKGRFNHPNGDRESGKATENPPDRP